VDLPNGSFAATAHAPGALVAVLVIAASVVPPFRADGLGDVWVGPAHVVLPFGPELPDRTRTCAFGIPTGFPLLSLAACQAAALRNGRLELSNGVVRTID
jgi:hypothetical protein